MSSALDLGQEMETKMVWPRFKVFWFRQSYRAQRKEKEEEADRKKVGRQYQSGQKWILLGQLRRLKTGQDGKGFLRTQLWCPDDHLRLWDRTENRLVNR